MRSVNLPSGAERNVNAGHVWKEVLTGAAGTFTLKHQQTFRVRADVAITVTIDGVLAMSMAAGEIEYFNAGGGIANNNTVGVSIVISGSAYVQVSEVLPTGRRAP